MTQSEKLKALIKKTYFFRGVDNWEIIEQGGHLQIHIEAENPKTGELAENDWAWQEILFNPRFAKDLFGEQDHDLFVIGTTGNGEHTTVNHPMPSWAYHLQHAVTALNPIDHMYKEVFGK